MAHCEVDHARPVATAERAEGVRVLAEVTVVEGQDDRPFRQGGAPGPVRIDAVERDGVEAVPREPADLSREVNARDVELPVCRAAWRRGHDVVHQDRNRAVVRPSARRDRNREREQRRHDQRPKHRT
jgi:hypothetical protein